MDFVSRFPKSTRDWLNGRRVEEVECIIGDFVGMSRGKAMPAATFARSDHTFLPLSIFYQTIAGDYVDMEIKNQWTESDMVLTPDYSTAVATPWSDDVSVQVIHDVSDLKGKPVRIVPRNVLKRVMSLYKKEGWVPVVAPEIEFYLTKRNIDPAKPIEPPMGRTGRRVVSRQAYSMMAVDDYGPVIDDIYDYAEAAGLEIDTIIQEGGAGQIEINLVHGDPVRLADQVFFFKRLIREAALKNDCFATFMAKPMQDEPGSAMHIHQSVLDENGNNIFSNENGSETDLFFSYIAGQQTYIPNAICLFAPYVNSYRRFVAKGSAPINLEWGADNRTTGIRIPISNPAARRVENRVVGMDANPYLALAASLACGYLGMKNSLTPRKSQQGEAYDKPRDLPRSLHGGLDLFDSAPELIDVLGEEFCSVYKAIKRHEAEAFLEVISPWEREHLLLNV
ncbi:MAG: glutamine synthetase family protein [Devosiaceae bacterium]|nr:glutamine synthetase family protein [Devosiaceae bacterium]